MALVFADLVRETTSTTGTGTLTLTGAVTNYQSFATIGNANTTYYRIISGADSEVGIGTYTLSGTTLSRDTVLYSSAGGTTKITVATGATVICTYPAEKVVILDASGNATALGTPAAFVATNVTGLPISTGVSGLATGVATFLATPSSANLATALTDETGSGLAVFATSPTLVSPALGTPTSGTLTNCTFPTLNQNTTGSAATVTGNATGSTFGFNSGYGSVATAYGCRAWVNFNGTGTVAIRASANVTSITDGGTGNYTVNFTTAMPDANYVAAGMCGNHNNFLGIDSDVIMPTSSLVRVRCYDVGGTTQDSEWATVAIFR